MHKFEKIIIDQRVELPKLLQSILDKDKAFIESFLVPNYGSAECEISLESGERVLLIINGYYLNPIKEESDAS